VMEVIAEQRRQGRTVLLISHLASDVERLCDRAAVLVGGRLAHLGPMAGLLRDPATGVARPLEHALQDLYERAAA
jgi:ABC-2 type transport system ATP-binding protein